MKAKGLVRKVQVKAQLDRAQRFGVGRVCSFLCALAATILLCIVDDAAVAQSKAKNVLVVFSSLEQRRDLGLIERSVRTHLPDQINFYDLYVDCKRLGEQSYRESLPETFRRAYRNVRLADWRPLQGWHIRESELLAGSVILYREPAVWDLDAKYFIPAIVLIAALLLLIIWLSWERVRKRKAEEALRESEMRFRTMADNTPSMIWMCDRQGRITYLNNGLKEFYGPDSDVYGDSWIKYVHPDDVNRTLEASLRCFEAREPMSKQFRARRWDGAYRWLFDVATPRLNEDGSFTGYIGSAMDITDQKLARETLEKVSGKLIEAQEQERRRIARELHDDICQRLTILSLELEQATRNGSPPETTQRLEEIRQHCSSIANDVQSLSHKLHSSRIDYLGIGAAIRGFCGEFARQHDVQIHFILEKIPPQLAKSTSLCLFRVTQEALHNAVKHSGVNEFTVELRGSTEQLRLVIADAGVGFDVEEAQTNRGLGLVSMQERVHLVHGGFSIESRRGFGTKVTAVVPALDAEPEPSLST